MCGESTHRKGCAETPRMYFPVADPILYWHLTLIRGEGTSAKGTQYSGDMGRLNGVLLDAATVTIGMSQHIIGVCCKSWCNAKGHIVAVAGAVNGVRRKKRTRRISKSPMSTSWRADV